MKNNAIKLTVLLTFIPFFQAISKEDQTATVTRIQGKVQIFHDPLKSTPIHSDRQKDLRVRFENESFLIREAKEGDLIQAGNIVRTFPGSAVTVVYANGDQFNVGPGTAYRVMVSDKNKDTQRINLMYGRFRGVISKEGPRKRLDIKTHTATMGVRGTDFFVADTGKNGQTEVSVLRGAVEVSREKESPKKVSTGMSASVSNEKVETRETTKEDLAGIRKSSEIQSASSSKLSVEVTQTISDLEKKALNVVKKDIQLYQPEVYQALKDEWNSVTSSQELSQKMLAKVSETAPAAKPKRSKPSITEMMDAEDQDVYDQYFKIKE